MKVSRLRRVVEVLRLEGVSVNRGGTAAQDWQSLGFIRAEILSAEGRDMTGKAGLIVREKMTFRARLVPGVSVADRVQFGGRVFDLEAVESDEAAGEMKLEAKLSEAGDA